MASLQLHDFADNWPCHLPHRPHLAALAERGPVSVPVNTLDSMLRYHLQGILEDKYWMTYCCCLSDSTLNRLLPFLRLLLALLLGPGGLVDEVNQATKVNAAVVAEGHLTCAAAWVAHSLCLGTRATHHNKQC